MQKKSTIYKNGILAAPIYNIQEWHISRTYLQSTKLAYWPHLSTKLAQSLTAPQQPIKPAANRKRTQKPLKTKKVHPPKNQQPTKTRASQTDKKQPDIGQGSGMWMTRSRLEASQNFTKFFIPPPL